MHAKECWSRAAIAFELPDKLKNCGKALSEWAKEKVGNTKQKIKKLVKEINEAQLEEDFEENYDCVHDKERELQRLLLQEEHYW